MKKLLAILLTLASLGTWLALSPDKGLPEAAAQTTDCLPIFHERRPPY